MVKILFLAANPHDTIQLQLNEEFRAIDDDLHGTKFRDRFDLKNHGAVRYGDLQRLLLRYEPDIIHFSGHGSTAGELILQDDEGNSHPVSTQVLYELFKILKVNIRCVVLNACYSKTQAEAIAQHIDCVIGMTTALSDKAALQFSTAFYRALGNGRSVQTAFDLACNEIGLANLGEQDIPQLLAPNADPAQVFLLTTEARPASHFIVEKLPDYFVERSSEFEPLLTLLLNAEGNEPVAITAALRGAGGYGKTTLALALCHDPRIRQTYYDGIHLVRLGENPSDLISKVLDLITTLTGQRPQFRTLDAAQEHLAEVLKGRKILLVIDDIWNADHLKPFCQGDDTCTRLLTTRNDHVLPAGTKKVTVDAMTGAEAASLLGAGLPTGEETALAALARRLGEWPLLLSLVNGTMRSFIEDGQSLASAIADADTALSESGLTVFDDPNNPAARDRAVAATMNASLRLLKAEEPTNYSQLAIFAEDADIPLVTVARLWNKSFVMTKLLCNQLDKLSLLQHFDLATNTLRLHDVMRTYLRQSGIDLTILSRQFLDSYAITNWYALPSDEPYLWSWLVYHLLEADRADDVAKLFADDRWLHVRVLHSEHSYNGYVADLMAIWERTHIDVLAQIKAGQSPTALAASVRYALIRTSLNSLAGSYDPALVVQAVKLGMWSSTHALGVASRMPDARQRAQMADALIGSGRLNDYQYQQAYKLCVNSVQPIYDQWINDPPYLHEGYDSREYSFRADLEILMRYLPAEAREQALSSCLQRFKNQDSSYFVKKALLLVAPHLNSNLLETALPVTNTIQTWERKDVIFALITNAQGDLPASILEIVKSSEFNNDRSEIIIALAPRLNSKQILEILNIVLSTPDERGREQPLLALFPFLSGELLRTTLEALCGNVNAEELSNAFATFVLHRPTASQELLAAVITIEHEYWRARCFSLLASHLTDDLLSESMDSIIKFKDLECLTLAFSSFIPRMGKEIPVEVLLIFLDKLRSASEGLQATVIINLGKDFTDDLKQVCLEITLAITDNELRGKTLAALTPHLNGGNQSKAANAGVAAVLDTDNRWFYVEPFVVFLPFLEDETREDALNKGLKMVYRFQQTHFIAPMLIPLLYYLSSDARTQIIDDILTGFQRRATSQDVIEELVAVLPYLAGELFDSTLKTTFTHVFSLDRKSERVDTFALLKPYLTGKMKNQAMNAALAAANSERYADSSVWAYWALLPYLDGELKVTAGRACLHAISAMAPEESQLEALASVVSYLTNEVLDDALDFALHTWHGFYKAQALAALAPYLNKDHLQKVFTYIVPIYETDNTYQRLAMMSLAPNQLFDEYLPPIESAVAKRMPSFIQDRIFVQMSPERRKASFPQQVSAAIMMFMTAMSTLYQYAFYFLDKPSYLNRKKILAWKLRNELPYVHRYNLYIEEILTKIVTVLENDSVDTSLEIVLAIENEELRADILFMFAPYLRGKSTQIASSAAYNLSDSKSCAAVLTALAPHLSDDSLSLALNLVQSIEDKHYQAAALARFLPYVRKRSLLVSEIRQLIADLLYHNYQDKARQEVLSFCRSQVLFKSILPKSVRSDIARHIREICNEWKWV